MTATTVLIVDDHPGFRAAARSVLAAAGFEVVGDVPDGRSGLIAAERSRPAVVVLDIAMPSLDGFAVAAALQMLDPPPAVVLVSSRDAADYGRRIAASGAVGFISKARLSGDTLRAVLRGRKEGYR